MTEVYSWEKVQGLLQNRPSRPVTIRCDAEAMDMAAKKVGELRRMGDADADKLADELHVSVNDLKVGCTLHTLSRLFVPEATLVGANLRNTAAFTSQLRLTDTTLLDLQGPFYVSKGLVCTQCGREKDFVDIVRTAKDNPVHGLSRLADILTGKDGYWLTVAGQHDKRKIICSKCGSAEEHEMVGTGIHYRGDNYTYA